MIIVSKKEAHMAHLQGSFSEIEHQSFRRTTKRSEFLKVMDEIICWDEWVEVIRPHYYASSKRPGRPPRDLEVMLRMHLMQVWFTLSDVGTEEACIDIVPMRSFLKLEGTDAQVPDATTLANFRHIIEEHKIDEALFGGLTEMLADNGVMYKGGTIVDATFIESTSSTKNATGKRDPEMHQAKKGRNWHHGMKLHIGVDAKSGIVHTLSTTPANISDIAKAHKIIRESDEVVYGDAGYVGIEKRVEIADDAHLCEVKYRINQRQSQVKTDFDKAIESRLSSVRSKVEHVFHIIKDIFGLRKTPYRGIDKNTTRLTMCVLSANLYMLMMARRRIDGSPLEVT
jgi:IS5 family transposase